MKIFYCIFLVIFSSFDNCFSQDSSAYVFHLNKLPPEGVLLDKGWKFQTGDNPDYAKSEYDDEAWQSINPTLDIHDLTQIPKSGICWFRLHLSIDSNLLKNQLALIINQSGASEIYLNGRLIHRFGIISINPKEIKAYDPFKKPVLFTISKDKLQLLAARFAQQPNVLYTKAVGRQNPALKIWVNGLDTSIDQYQHTYTGFTASIIFRVGAFLILVILHFAFYIFYPSQKANLYFCLYALLTLMYEIVNTSFRHEVKDIFYANNFIEISSQFGIFFMLTAIYSLFNQKRQWIYWALLVFTVIAILLNNWPYQWGWTVGALITNFIYIEITRISFISVKNKKRGAWIIATGSLCFLIFWLAFLLGIPLNYFSVHLGSTYIIGDLFYNVANLSIPIATSIYLGLDFAFTNRELQQKLKEVEELSKKGIVQEKEKQQILATQNELQIKAMVITQEQERKRISRDLHDDVGTKLSALNLFLSSLSEKATVINNDEIKSLACSSKQFIKEAMYDIRQLLFNLSPTILEEFGYTTAVEGLVNKINETKQIHFDLVVFGINHRLKKDYELALYRITQELINNVLKHAEAKHVSLQIGQRDEKIILMMEDDGKGFDVNAHKDGYGLNNLDARTKLMQGTMTIDSQPGKGTSVLIEVPYNFNGV